MAASSSASDIPSVRRSTRSVVARARPAGDRGVVERVVEPEQPAGAVARRRSPPRRRELAAYAAPWALPSQPEDRVRAGTAGAASSSRRPAAAAQPRLGGAVVAGDVHRDALDEPRRRAPRRVRVQRRVRHLVDQRATGARTRAACVQRASITIIRCASTRSTFERRRRACTPPRRSRSRRRRARSGRVEPLRLRRVARGDHEHARGRSRARQVAADLAVGVARGRSAAARRRRPGGVSSTTWRRARAP